MTTCLLSLRTIYRRLWVAIGCMGLASFFRSLANPVVIQQNSQGTPPAAESPGIWDDLSRYREVVVPLGQCLENTGS